MSKFVVYLGKPRIAELISNSDFSLEVIYTVNVGASISSITIVSGGTLILVGLESGQVYLLAPVR